jgi:hypothetical protein
LVCAGTDQVWDSCLYASAIMNRLGANHDPQPHVLLAYPNAGHGIAGLIRYEPGGFDSYPPDVPGHSTSGATQAANSTALEGLWPEVQIFLAHPTLLRSS